MAAVIGRKILVAAASMLIVYALENPDVIKAKFRKLVRKVKEILGIEEVPIVSPDPHFQDVVSSLYEENDDLAPFKCPISLDIMVDPVITPYGHCYDRRNIEDWLDREEVCPLTRRPLTISQLQPCIPLKHALEKFARLNRRLADLEVVSQPGS